MTVAAPSYDLAIVGAGIIGLGHALAAARRGLKTIVIDRDAQSNGASIRNFGFITVTGQAAGDMWRRAHRSRVIWDEIVGPAGIPVVHRGTALLARSDEAMAVAEEFAAGAMGEGCEVLPPATLDTKLPMARRDGVRGFLWSPHELRVEPRTAVPAVAKWLETAQGVTFLRGAAVTEVAPPRVETSRGPVHAARVVVCPGPDLVTLFPETIAKYRPTLCKLQMLRLAPQGRTLGASVMMDLSFGRYLGFDGCPSVGALRARIARLEPETLANGIHLIVVQSADGSLVVGDSHHYAPTPDPFAPDVVDQLILRHAKETLDLTDDRIVERWTGVYPSSGNDTPAFFDTPLPDVRVAMVTSGAGMSTGFALAEEVIADLYG
jgi:FAD dependent oxidoreductase TIGR03364